jgi:DNA-binding transcriptional regulator YiaG
MENQGLMIKHMRKVLNMNQQELAKIWEVTHAQISNYERNKTRIPDVYIDKLVNISGFTRTEIEHSIYLTKFKRDKPESKKDMSQTELAELKAAYGVSMETLNKMLSDQSETIKQQQKIILTLIEQTKK